MTVNWPEGEPAARFVLPLPPSVNNMFVTRRDGRGRAATSAYKSWQKEAGWAIALSPFGRGELMGLAPLKHTAVMIEAGFDYRRDLDNGTKAALDLIKTHGVIVDDRWVDKLLVERVPGDRLTVSVWAL